jgi:amino acid adenylation domain-containing protein
MRVESFLEQRAADSADKTALISGERRLTYRQLDHLAAALADRLRALGLQRGDRVAVFTENCPEAVATIFGVLKADGVFVMINPTTKAQKLSALLQDCRPVAVVADSRRLPTAVESVASVASVRGIVVAGGDGNFEMPAGAAVLTAFPSLADVYPPPTWKRGIDLDLAALIYTSGSTGKAKGVMLTHRNMVSAATSITTYLQNRPDDIILNVLPLSFDYGLYQVLMSVQFGGTVVLERSFVYLHAVLETLRRERVTGFPIVPTIAALLLELDLAQYDLSSLRYITSTGAALPTAHINELRRCVPHAKMFSMYGLTECKRVSYLDPADLDRRPGSVGRGMPNEELYLIDADGTRLPYGVGELVVRGSHVMQGYWERPDDTAQVLMPGPLPGENVLRTGDTFRMVVEGYLYFVGRRDDIIKTRGEKVSPREVEDVLHQLDGVAEAAVIGVPDPILGQAIKAVVVARAGACITEQDVFRHCGSQLEYFMVPHTIEIRDALPKTPNGKRDYRALLAEESLTAARTT